MSIFDHFRGGGKSAELNYKVLGQVNHNIISTKDLVDSKYFGGIRRIFGDLGVQEVQTRLFSVILGVRGQLVE